MADPDQDTFKEAGKLVHSEGLKKVGITPDTLNEKAAEELESETVHWIKVKGLVPSYVELPDNYTVLHRGADESIIEHRGPRWETQQKARMDLQKRLNMYPSEKLDVSHTLDDVFERSIMSVMGSRRGKLPIEE